MSFKKRLITAAAVLLVTLAAAVIAVTVERSGLQAVEEELLAAVGQEKETVLVWYTDEALTDYLSSTAVAFNELPENQDIRVIPALTSGLEYLENINQASVNREGPDLYIVGHDSLEKAYLAGLAAEIKLPDGADFLTAYPEVGLHAATYHGKILGYPFYFETSALLYNRTYLMDMARAQLVAEADVAAAEAAQQELEENGPPADGGDTAGGVTTEAGQNTAEGDTVEAGQDTAGGAAAEAGQDAAEGDTADAAQLQDDNMAVENRAAALLPRTLDDMKSFADNYDAPEQVESVFKWDVNDIFYNYFFVGNSMTVGGESGDDTANIDIYNENAINSMKMYQNLSQFFAIETGAVKYSSLIDDFIAGKLVFTVATTDAVARLDQAAGEGTFAYEYSITRTPDINPETPTRSMSMTNCAVINGYSDHQEEANRFAYFLTKESAVGLYARSGKVAAAREIAYEHPALDYFAAEYARSVPLPKMIETSNFWVQLEIAFARIWDGADANGQLKRLSEQIMTQITGESYTEEAIIEEAVETEVEYLDEDALRQEALQEQ